MSGVGGGNGLGGNGLRGGGALLSGIKTGISGFTGGPPPPPPIAPLGDLSRSLFNAGTFIDLSTLPGGPQVGANCPPAEGVDWGPEGKGVQRANKCSASGHTTGCVALPTPALPYQSPIPAGSHAVCAAPLKALP